MDQDVAQHIAENLTMLAGVERIEFLARGYSQDRKFVLWEQGKPRYLLRVSSLAEQARRHDEFELLQTHYRRGVPCSKPHAWGVSEAKDVCYSVLGYTDGESAEDVLAGLSSQRQYQIGLEAGRQLRRLHELEGPQDGPDWCCKMTAKYERRRQEAAELGIKIGRQQERAERFIKHNLETMRGCRSFFRHGDYHVGNLIVKDEQLAGIIDFNRCDWGDPIEDFYKISMFSAFVSRDFSRGQVDGYHGGQVPPPGFWRLLNLYVAMVAPSALVWAFRYDPKMDWWRQRLMEMLSQHDLEDGGPPAWYK